MQSESHISVPEPAIERHPLDPFLPEGAKLLMLGSFPPSQKRWSMDFFYPNFANDMWRVFGLLYFGDPAHFYLQPAANAKGYDKAEIVKFLTERGIAIFDTACAVRRLKGTASDADLEIAEPTDIRSLLWRLPECKAIAATGGKASTQAATYFGVEEPAVGARKTLELRSQDGTGAARSTDFYRMPSTSRAYPLPLIKKAAAYGGMLRTLRLL
jgi:G:T/U-mismatch repair DNA glycosylase